MNKLALIFALAKNGIIGNKGKLPWDFPEDRAHFFRTTRGHAVILGRRTWEEQNGMPLPDRTNIVVSSSSSSTSIGDALVVRSLDDALERAWQVDDEPFVIGGVRLFEEALPRATRIYMTEIPGEHEGDVIFSFDRNDPRFEIVSERESTITPGLRFLVFERLEPHS